MASPNENDNTFEHVIEISDDENVELKDEPASAGKRKSTDMDSDDSET